MLHLTFLRDVKKQGPAAISGLHKAHLLVLSEKSDFFLWILNYDFYMSIKKLHKRF